jgi:hypothetical protein
MQTSSIKWKFWKTFVHALLWKMMGKSILFNDSQEIWLISIKKFEIFFDALVKIFLHFFTLKKQVKNENRNGIAS